MKFDLEAQMKSVDGRPMVQGQEAVPITLRHVIHMALSSDPTWEQGPRMGEARPLTVDEQMKRVRMMQLMTGKILDVTTEEAADIKAIARIGLLTALSLPVAALMDSGGNVPDDDSE